MGLIKMARKRINANEGSERGASVVLPKENAVVPLEQEGDGKIPNESELREILAAAEARAELAERALSEHESEMEANRVAAVILGKIHAVAIKEGKLDGLGVKALKKHVLDMSLVRHEAGEVLNMSEILEHFKADDVIGALWGGADVVEGACAGGAVAVRARGLTLDAVRVMSTEEISENWNLISKMLENNL